MESFVETVGSSQIWNLVSVLSLLDLMRTRSQIVPTTLTGLVESRFADLVGLFLVNTVCSSSFSFDEFYFIFLRNIEVF